jgi:hypothetical protein
MIQTKDGMRVVTTDVDGVHKVWHLYANKVRLLAWPGLG